MDRSQVRGHSTENRTPEDMWNVPCRPGNRRKGRKPENDQSENWVRTTKISGSEIAGKSAEKSANLMFGK